MRTVQLVRTQKSSTGVAALLGPGGMFLMDLAGVWEWEDTCWGEPTLNLDLRKCFTFSYFLP